MPWAFPWVNWLSTWRTAEARYRLWDRLFSTRELRLAAHGFLAPFLEVNAAKCIALAAHVNVAYVCFLYCSSVLLGSALLQVHFYR